MTVEKYLNTFAASPRPHEWVCRFDLPQVLRSALQTKGVDLGVVENIDLLAEGHQLPGVTLGIIELFLKGAPYSYPQRSSRSGEFTLSFKEILDKNLNYGVWKFFTEWTNLADSAEEGVGLPPNSLKGDMVIDFYPYLNTELNANPPKLFSIRYKFLYPTTVEDFTELSQESTDIVKPSVAFLYDLWKYE